MRATEEPEVVEQVQQTQEQQKSQTPAKQQPAETAESGGTPKLDSRETQAEFTEKFQKIRDVHRLYVESFEAWLKDTSRSASYASSSLNKLIASKRYALVEELISKIPESSWTKIESVGFRLIQALIADGEHESAIRLMNQKGKAYSAYVQRTRIQLYGSFVNYYLQKGDVANAEKYVEMAGPSIPDPGMKFTNEHRYAASVRWSLANHYLKQDGGFKKAKSFVDSTYIDSSLSSYYSTLIASVVNKLDAESVCDLIEREFHPTHHKKLLTNIGNTYARRPEFGDLFHVVDQLAKIEPIDALLPLDKCFRRQPVTTDQPDEVGYRFMSKYRELIDQAVERGLPEDRIYYGRLRLVYQQIRLGKIEEALRFYDQNKSKITNSGNASTYFVAPLYRFITGSSDDKRSFEIVNRIEDHSIKARLLVALGTRYRTENETEKIAFLLEKYGDMIRNDSKYRANLLLWALDIDRVDLAIQEIELDNNRNRDSDRFKVFQKFMARGESQRAFDWMEQFEYKTSYFRNAAREFAKVGMYRESAELLRQMTPTYQKSSMRYLFSDICLANGVDAALTFVQDNFPEVETLSIDSKVTGYIDGLGFEKSIQEYQKIDDRFPNSTAERYLSRAYAKAGKVEKAFEILDRQMSLTGKCSYTYVYSNIPKPQKSLALRHALQAGERMMIRTIVRTSTMEDVSNGEIKKSIQTIARISNAYDRSYVSYYAALRFRTPNFERNASEIPLSWIEMSKPTSEFLKKQKCENLQQLLKLSIVELTGATKDKKILDDLRVLKQDLQSVMGTPNQGVPKP